MILAYNMAVPLHVRLGVFGQSLDIDELMSGFDRPVLVTHGADDAIWQPIISEHAASVIPGAELSIYPGVGHSPFFEEPERFNAELAALVRRANSN